MPLSRRQTLLAALLASTLASLFAPALAQAKLKVAAIYPVPVEQSSGSAASTRR